MQRNEVVISGCALLSHFGESAQAHCDAILNDGQPPGTIPIGKNICVSAINNPLNLLNHIAKSDRRQMGPWQEYGLHVAIAALNDAGLGEKEDRVEIHMHVAAQGGGRNLRSDDTILAIDPDVGANLNAAIKRHTRPSQFLAELPNLLAGNIAHLLGINGPSRTFMGGLEAGFQAIDLAYKQLSAGQAKTIIVIAVSNCEPADKWLEIIAHNPNDSLFFASQAVALVLEHGRAAASRGVTTTVGVERIFAGTKSEELDGSTLAYQCGLRRKRIDLVTTMGHAGEAQFPAQLALGAALVQTGNADQVFCPLGRANDQNGYGLRSQVDPTA